MADPTVTLLEYLRKVGVDLDGDFLSQGTRLMAQLAIELEAEQEIGAGRYERSPQRTTYRDGHRERVWETRVGEIPLRIPKLREGDFFPSLLEPRRRAEKALLVVVQAAYVQGVTTRKFDQLLQALGLTGIDTPALAGGASESKISRICRELDVFVEAFRNRLLEGGCPYLWLDALYLKVRQDHRIVSQALIVAIAVRDAGDREILGVSLGQSDDYAFSRKDIGTVWRDVLRGLGRRGLKGLQLVTSDAHEGLKAAVDHVLSGET